ncbi:DUF1835 domain-containing protein [Aquabacter sp. CN5-332]|uniref:DUF1835 domain-containing protein n=1 Tax=Aquabacter sp. CN5-332 TaxID=3156608 RepID=UPI0032B34D0F
MPKLIVTNGDSAAGNIREAGIHGHLLEWRDMLHDGPVPADDDLEVVSDTRAAYLAETFGLEFDSVRSDFAQRDGQIGAHIAYRDVELWFEHDLYDQLQLIQLLAFFAHEPERLGLKLVQADDYLGAMGPEAICALVPKAAPITAMQLEAGQHAWAAFTAPTPTAMAGLAAAPIPELPFLAPAFRRSLCELPAPGNGLSLTEERILRALVDGPRKVGHLFGAVTAQDEAKFLADLPFFQRVDALAFAREPLITGVPFRANECRPFTPAEEQSPQERTYRAFAGTEIALTPAGEAALKGEFDHAAENRVDRWLGGTHIRPNALWRYDRTTQRLKDPN